MAQSSAPKYSFAPPNITPTDLETFHKTHFSTTSIEHFSTHFLGPVTDDEYQEEEEEDDGLGYYPDGVKRTLTDEQIAMFRHSEIQALLKERRHAQEKKSISTPSEDHASEAEEGELEDDQTTPGPEPQPELPPPTSRVEQVNAPNGNAKQKKTGRNKRGGQKNKQPPKPDLRKRTWDKVDCGLGSLDYGAEEDGNAALPAASQRRRISYDDV